LIRSNAVVQPGTCNAHDMTIDPSGAVSADGLFNSGTGVGQGTSSGFCGGGAYGGRGGMASTNVLGGNSYGTIDSVTQTGAAAAATAPLPPAVMAAVWFN